MDETNIKKPTPRQIKFAYEYAKDRNARRAAIAAGYSEKTADREAHELVKNLAKLGLLEEAEQSADRIRQELEIDLRYVLVGLKEIVERCLQRKPVMEYDRETKSWNQKIDDEGRYVWEFDAAGANKALEMLGKHLKMFTDKIEVKADESLIERYRRACKNANQSN